MHVVSALGEGYEPTPPAVGRMPSAALYLTEPMRGLLTMATLPLGMPLLALAPRGDGHGVLVLPGLLAGDGSTRPIRRFLTAKGYDVRGWGLGRNVGPTQEIVDAMPGLLAGLVEETGGPVSVVGWSLGGIYARELARNQPELVRQVITLVSPFARHDVNQSRADAAFRRQSSRHVRSGLFRRGLLSQPILVPSTAVYSHADGIVDWRSCIEPSTAIHENVAVRSGHLGVGVDAAVMWLLADRLALPAQGWRPFRAPTMLRPCFPEES
jgi:pimeloyl-ACP methyl ester carboxylesterase